MSEKIITTENFVEEVEKSPVPVLVDFFATWCGPCRMLSPIIEEIAAEYDGKIKVGTVNVDEEPALAEKFGVESIPTLIVFKDGKPANSSVGYIPKESVEALLS